MLGVVDIPGARGPGEFPLVVSLPHAGLMVPADLAPFVTLGPEKLVREGDGGAHSVYGGLAGRSSAFLATDVARAIVDVNRAPGDGRPDGAVKVRTSWDDIVYAEPPPNHVLRSLLYRYHHPYHRRLAALARVPGVLLGVDCHTMASIGPPRGPDPGRERPLICLSNGDGTCPDEWLTILAEALESRFDGGVQLNDPFTGGHIIRSHAAEMPWVQLEISRTDRIEGSDKRRAVEGALAEFCERVVGGGRQST